MRNSWRLIYIVYIRKNLTTKITDSKNFYLLSHLLRYYVVINVFFLPKRRKINLCYNVEQKFRFVNATTLTDLFLFNLRCLSVTLC